MNTNSINRKVLLQQLVFLLQRSVTRLAAVLTPVFHNKIDRQEQNQALTIFCVYLQPNENHKT